MLGNRGLRQSEVLGQLNYPVFAEQKMQQNGQPRWIAEPMEKAGGVGQVSPTSDRIGIFECHRHIAMIATETLFANQQSIFVYCASRFHACPDNPD